MAGQKRAQAPILKWRPGASVSAALRYAPTGAAAHHVLWLPGSQGSWEGRKALTHAISEVSGH